MKKFCFKHIMFFTLAVNLFIAIILRMTLGSNLMFYAYHNSLNFFPGRVFYAFLSILRLILCSYVVSFLLSKNNVIRFRVLVPGIISILYIFIEYWLVFFKESILTVIVLCAITIYLNLKFIKKYFNCRNNYNLVYIVTLVYCLIQAVIIICLASIII